MADDSNSRLDTKDNFPEQPRPFRHIALRTDIRGAGPGVKEALWLQSGRQYNGTVRVGIPGPEGFLDAVVPIAMLREGLDKIEEFDPEKREPEPDD